MKVFQIFIVGLLILIFVASAVGQREETQVTSTAEIAIINTNAFEDKQSGIKELVVAYDRLDAELKPKYDELNKSPVKIKLEELHKELLEKKAILEKYTVGCRDPEFFRGIQVKFDEYNKLISEFEIGAKNYKALYDKRKSEIVAPVNSEITKALNMFREQNGYVLVIDNSRLDTHSMLAKPNYVDITEKFIKYFNENFGKSETQ